MNKSTKEIINRNIIIIFLFAISPSALAINYYFSTTGSDSADGHSTSTPWRTLTKFNTEFARLNPGDSVLFKRGDTFYGTLLISRSGTASRPIVIGAYGTGAKPVINGFTTLSSWTDEGNGIYSKTLICESDPNMVTVNGVNTPMGRWPNKGWMTIDSHQGHTSITDAELPFSPDWTGAEVAIRVSHWIIDRNRIVNRTGTTLNYTSFSGNEASDGYGYFIQDALETLDLFGEWYYNGTTFYMYFGGENPDDHIIKVSSIDDLVRIQNGSYIIFHQISLTGANSKAINLQSSSHITIQYCNIDLSGADAISGGTNRVRVSDFLIIDNTSINHSNNNAIVLDSGFPNAIVRKNTIQNTGIIPGMGGSGVDKYTAILIRSDGIIIEYNNIINTGYIPVAFYGEGSIVKNNFINNFCSVKDDGGGIYTNGTAYKEIIKNIIINGIGASAGTAGGRDNANGIYIDDGGTNTLISDNTIAHCSRAGIYLHNAHENQIKNNTCYNNSYSQLLLVHDNNYPDDPIRNITINDNILFAKEVTEYAFVFATRVDDIDLFGTADNNYYARPMDDEKTIVTWTFAWGGVLVYRSLADWQSYSGQDANSNKSPSSVVDVYDNRIEQNPKSIEKVVTIDDAYIDIDNIRFEYNASGENRVVLLDEPYINIKGVKFTHSFTLSPYTSMILMRLCNLN